MSPEQIQQAIETAEWLVKTTGEDRLARHVLADDALNLARAMLFMSHRVQELQAEVHALKTPGVVKGLEDIAGRRLTEEKA